MKKIKNNTYISEGHITLGAYRIGPEVLLIDSGKSASYLQEEWIDLNTMNIRYLFNTHGHADHCAGNRFLVDNHHPIILAPCIEADYIEYPNLKDVYLFGLTPRSILKDKSIYAAPAPVDQRVCLNDTSTDIDGSSTTLSLSLDHKDCVFKIISLKGHSPNMMGIVTPDDIAFLGDVLLSERHLASAPLVYTYDIADHLNTLKQLRDFHANGFVLSHGGYTDDIHLLVASNINNILRASEIILDLITKYQPLTLDQLHAKLYHTMGLNEVLLTQQLHRRILMSHLLYLQEKNVLFIEATEGVVLLHTL